MSGSLRYQLKWASLQSSMFVCLLLLFLQPQLSHFTSSTQQIGADGKFCKGPLRFSVSPGSVHPIRRTPAEGAQVLHTRKKECCPQSTWVTEIPFPRGFSLEEKGKCPPPRAPGVNPKASASHQAPLGEERSWNQSPGSRLRGRALHTGPQLTLQRAHREQGSDPRTGLSLSSGWGGERGALGGPAPVCSAAGSGWGLLWARV